MKVSIEREELAKLRKLVDVLQPNLEMSNSQDWLDAMTLLNAMIGKGEEGGESLFDGSALGPRGHTDPGDENLVVDGRLPPEYVTRQEMEEAMKAAHDAIVKATAIIEEEFDKRLKAHEAERHDVGQPSHDDCAHFIVCGLPKPCAGVCGFYQKPLKS